VLERLRYLFEQENGLFQAPDLCGHFAGEESFYITPKWSFMSIRNFENDPAMLKGVVSEIGLKRSRIEIVVRPNSIFLIFFIILLFFGLFQLTMIFTGENSNNHFFGAVIIIGGALPFWIWQATRVTGSIRKNFEEYLGIHSEEV
jgi:hypothetical protein